MFSKDLEQLMLDAQKEAYGDGLDPDAMHPYMWACKPHYYSSGLSFYNFPYAFGGLFSKAYMPSIKSNLKDSLRNIKSYCVRQQ